VMDVKALSMGLLRNGDAGATADNLLLAARQFGLDYAAANDYLDTTYETIHGQWNALGQALGETPLAPPAFTLPPRQARVPERDWKKYR